jgi:hypothetical protein
MERETQTEADEDPSQILKIGSPPEDTQSPSAACGSSNKPKPLKTSELFYSSGRDCEKADQH